ncbi:putative RNA helicase SDE3 [Fulvia fulva]|uniref:RNA helicase SDE3 n=1 Tax=Passalora fulva TaxID=5499 RepID=A0A9Q8PIG1_PASFU|nr:putative RNA helicase SDE3 [Fulvia fulva]KAK4628449.1 putative RNA helicase SDE3 [Fulvia fulva]UJO23026.1 putative RNA helicase SDE3 [Fulvia fulva]WPV28809.1 putative RNA helicase SDE3 [Fulvia fulva]
MADKPAKFDVYARPYVPQELKYAPAPSIHYYDYVLSFAGRWLDRSRDAGTTQNQDEPVEFETTSPADKEAYVPFFSRAFTREVEALQTECEEYDIVPGLRENNIRVEVGDIVHVRQLRLDHRGELLTNTITDAAGMAIVTAYPVDVQHDAVVCAINRQYEVLTLRIDQLFPGGYVFNVCFTLQHTRLEALHTALYEADHALRYTENTWLRSMLFPENCDCAMQRRLNPMFSTLAVFDCSLNSDQKRAVEAVLDQKYGTVPYIYRGRREQAKHSDSAHLLLCAPSDQASDTLVERLARHLQPANLLRLNSSTRSAAEVPASILPWCYMADNLFTLPEFPVIMEKRVVVVTCRDADMLHKARLCNRDIFQLECNIHAKLHRTAPLVVPRLHWTSVIIDEAAQALEMEALLPLLVVAPPNVAAPEVIRPSVIMVGDEHQLGPRTASKDPAIQRSLFERILARPQSKGVIKPLTQGMLPILRPPFTNLIRNYRSHPAILAIPSSLFYNDTLEPHAKNTDALLAWSGFEGRQMPVLFTDVRAPDECQLDGGGWYNEGEAEVALTTAQSFLSEGLLEQQEICIISPFRAQVKAFQGLESRLVILCTTRTRDRFVDQDIAKGLGVIHEPRRFNVALTRAKERLIVIGNPHALDQDDDWAPFLAFCQRNSAWRSEHEDDWQAPHSSKIKTSRLEKRIAYRNGVETRANGIERRLGNLKFGMSEDETIWQSGVAVEKMLEEEDGENEVTAHE